MALGSVEFLHRPDWMLPWSFANLGGKKKKTIEKKTRIASQLINHDFILFQSLLISLQKKKPRRSWFIKIK